MAFSSGSLHCSRHCSPSPMSVTARHYCQMCSLSPKQAIHCCTPALQALPYSAQPASMGGPDLCNGVPMEGVQGCQAQLLFEQ